MYHTRLRILLNLSKQSGSRSYFRQANPSNPSRWGPGRRTAIGASVVAGTTLALTTVTDDGAPKKVSTLGSLIRTYAVYTMCSFPSLVDASPRILSLMSSVPGLKQITEAFVRVTFFDQFVGADTAEDALPLLRSLRSTKKGVLFAYSVEVDEDEANGTSSSSSAGNTTSTVEELPFMHLVDETIHCIDVAADFEAEVSDDGSQGRRTWIAVKMTALLPDAHALIALSSHITEARKMLPKSCREAAIPFPGSPRIEDLDVILHDEQYGDHVSLSLADIKDLKRLYADLSRICAHAKDKGIKIIIDAEYSWYQPAIDALTLALMREFNSCENPGNVQPLVYGTFQCYLRRTPEQLALAIEDSRKHNYALGVKIVRGAYHPHELAAHEAAIEFNRKLSSGQRTSLSISPDTEPPVWRQKSDTDYAYNQCVKLLIGLVSQDVQRTPITDVAEAKGAWGWSKLWWGTRSLSSEPAPPVNSIPRLGVLFGTHNWESCALILKELLRTGLAVNDPDVEGGIKVGSNTIERIAVGQLYGMCDDLTDWVVSKVSSATPFVIKYVPYGALAEVMPYLGRRAIENKSVLGEGHAQYERKMAAKEIKKRIFG